MVWIENVKILGPGHFLSAQELFLELPFDGGRKAYFDLRIPDGLVEGLWHH
jgi:hypothetical protein